MPPTLTVRKLTYEELKARLPEGSRIAIVSCNDCARLSNGLGGEESLHSLADQLTADGFPVTVRCLLPKSCMPAHLQEQLQDPDVQAGFDEADFIIPLSCPRGEKVVTDATGEDRLFQVCQTLGKGPVGPDGTAVLQQVFADTPLEVTDPETGIPLDKAATQLGLHAGPFEDSEPAG